MAAPAIPYDSGGASYDTLRARHTFQYDSYLGGARYRAPSTSTLTSAVAWTYTYDAQGSQLARTPRRYTSYLVPFPAESDDAYECRLAKACYLNLVQPIVDAYAEAVTSNVTRVFPPALGELTDVDHRGSSWGEHVEEVARWACLYGYGFTVVDAPAADPSIRTRADELAADRKPRVVIVHPTGVAWIEVDQYGRITEFAYVEDAYLDDAVGATSAVTGTQKLCVRVWSKDGWEVRVGTVRTSEGLSTQRAALGTVAKGPDGQDLKGPLPPALKGELPVVPFFYRRISASRYPLGQSLVDDACDVARSIYNKLSQEDEIHDKASFPFLAIPMADSSSGMDPATKVAIGPGRGMGFSSGTGAPQWVQPSSESSAELRASCLFRFMLALRSAGLEVAADQSAQVQSGEALRIRSRDFESRAKRFAQNMARYERQVLKLYWQLAGVSAETVVEYGKRFTLPDQSEDLNSALRILKEMPVEIGAEAKQRIVRKALDAVLSLSDEEMGKVMEEVRRLFEDDKADLQAERAARARVRDRAPVPPPNGFAKKPTADDGEETEDDAPAEA